MLINIPDEARRLARVILSDISLYNPEKIKEGIEADTLFETLAEELEEGRELYKSKVAPELLASSNFFDLAIVDVLFGMYSKKYESKIW